MQYWLVFVQQVTGSQVASVHSIRELKDTSRAEGYLPFKEEQELTVRHA